MKKIMLIMVTCLMLVGLTGCSSSALSITKQNYEKYGYGYADVELAKMTKDGDYEIQDLIKAREFLIAAEFGKDVSGKSVEELQEELDKSKR